MYPTLALLRTHLYTAYFTLSLEGRALCNLGAAHALLSHHTEADAYYQHSLMLFDRIDHQTEAARTRWSYGQFLVRQGKRERGIVLMAECVTYEQRIGHAKANEHATLVEQIRADGELPA